jgi:hypothetical protein
MNMRDLIVIWESDYKKTHGKLPEFLNRYQEIFEQKVLEGFSDVKKVSTAFLIYLYLSSRLYCNDYGFFNAGYTPLTLNPLLHNSSLLN